MKSIRFLLLLFAAVATSLTGCNPASDLADQEGVTDGQGPRTVQFEDRLPVSEASCPCFSLASLSGADRMLSEEGGPAADYYLFFDVFDYYELDPRRTEARSLVYTSSGLFEEVASVYVTQGVGDERFLICHRQEVIQDPVSGEPTYSYETLSPTLEQAEACRQTLYASVGDQEPCQGPACGLPYTKDQLDPGYALYHDDNYRTTETLLDRLRQQVEDVERLLQQPS